MDYVAMGLQWGFMGRNGTNEAQFPTILNFFQRSQAQLLKRFVRRSPAHLTGSGRTATRAAPAADGSARTPFSRPLPFLPSPWRRRARFPLSWARTKRARARGDAGSDALLVTRSCSHCWGSGRAGWVRWWLRCHVHSYRSFFVKLSIVCSSKTKRMSVLTVAADISLLKISSCKYLIVSIHAESSAQT
jgi:hypothetical protein